LNIFQDGLHFLTHLNDYLDNWLELYGTWLYAILFLIIFTETGLVLMPLLPGDSLLFAAGALAARAPETFSIYILIPLLVLAALMGDNLNYFIGRRIGVKIFDLKWKLLRKEYLHKTEDFYAKYGGQTLIMARFVPIVRTFAPFVAGMGKMPYSRFIVFCVCGAILWVCSISILGYLLGKNIWVRTHFELVVFGIIGISLLPILIGFLRAKLSKKPA
jgi:membrane-associated protein